MTGVLGVCRHHVSRNAEGQFRHIGSRRSLRDLFNRIDQLRIMGRLRLRGYEQSTDGQRKRLQEILARHGGPHMYTARRPSSTRVDGSRVDTSNFITKNCRELPGHRNNRL